MSQPYRMSGVRDTRIAISMLRSLIYFLSTRGLDSHAIANTIGLSDELLEQRDRLVSTQYYIELMQAAIKGTGDPLLGLRFGMAVEPDRWGTLGVLLAHCGDVDEAIRFQSRFQTLITTVGHASLQAGKPGYFLSWQAPADVPPALTEEALAAWVNFGRWATGLSMAPEFVTFAHEAQGDRAVYERFFQAPVHFGQPMDGLQISADILEVPLRNPDPDLKAWLSRRARQLEERNRDAPVIHTRLAQWFAEQLPFGVPSLAQAATALGMSERTLQRQLHQSETTFQACMGEARMHLAEQYLRDAALSIGDIGLLLGFSEQSAFQRAFKRWHGITPRAWRRA